ncbi:MAG: hypothetical protein R3C03_13115 [Pirellulaceae bacterium]
MEQVQSVDPVTMALVTLPTWILISSRRCFFIVVGLLMLPGCTHHRNLVEEAHRQYWSGDIAGSAKLLNEAIEKPQNDLDPLLLDQAMLEFHNGNLGHCQKLLLEVQQRNQTSKIQTIAENSTAYLSDDTHRRFEMDEHEQILLNVMLLLSSLIGQDGDAHAFALQLGEQCQELLASRPAKTEEDANAAPSEVVEQAEIDPVKSELAIGPLLQALTLGESPTHHDELLRHLATANDWRPDSPMLNSMLIDAANGVQAPEGHGTVFVISLVGRGPRKITSLETVTSDATLAADRMLSELGDYSLPPTIAPIKVARIELSPLTFDRILVSVDGHAAGETTVVSDIGRLAVERQQELMPQIIARAVVRRMLKKGVMVAAKKKSGVERDQKNNASSLAWDAVGVVWEAIEKPDLRGWSLLPGSIQILRLDLPAGNHQLTFAPTMYGNVVGESYRGTVHVQDGRTTFITTIQSDAAIPGRMRSIQTTNN